MQHRRIGLRLVVGLLDGAVSTGQLPAPRALPGLQPVQPGAQFLQDLRRTDRFTPGFQVLGRRRLAAVLQLVHLGVRPAQPLRETGTGEPAARAGYAQLPEPRSESLTRLLEVRAHRYTVTP